MKKEKKRMKMWKRKVKDRKEQSQIEKVTVKKGKKKEEKPPNKGKWDV